MGRKGKKGGEKQPGKAPAAPNVEKGAVQKKQSAMDPKPGPSGDPGIRLEQETKSHEKQSGRAESQQRSQGGAGSQQQRQGDQASKTWGPSGPQQEQRKSGWGADGSQKQRQQLEPGQAPPSSGRPQQHQQGGQAPPGWSTSGSQQQQQKLQPGQAPPGWGAGVSPQHQRGQAPAGTGGSQPKQPLPPGQVPSGWGAGASRPQQQQQHPGQAPSAWGESRPHQHQTAGQAPPGWGAGASPQHQRGDQAPPGTGGSQPKQPLPPGQVPPGWGAGASQPQQQHPGQAPSAWGASRPHQYQTAGQAAPGWGAGASPQHQRGSQAPSGWHADRSQPAGPQQQQHRKQTPVRPTEFDGQSQRRKSDVVKGMEKMELSTKKQGKQQAGSQGEKKSVIIRSITMDYNIGSATKAGQIIKWCGTAGSKHQIETNYLELNLNKLPDIAYQYDVKFSIEKPTRFRPEAFEQFRVNVLNRGRGVIGFPIAFDTMNIAFSAEKIDASLLNVAHPVVFIDSATNAEKKLDVTINEAGDVELHLLKNYSTTGITERHIRAVQCVDVVLRTAPMQVSKQVGRAFYKRPDNPPDLRDGFDLWLGLFQALVLGEIPMLNIDIAHKGFPRAGNLLDMYDKNGRDTEYFIKNLNIIYDPPRAWNTMSKLYKANEFVKSAQEQTFVKDDGQKMSIAEYFQSKNYQLKRPDAPCVSVGLVRKICLPIELCRVQEGQDVKKRAGKNQVRELIRHAATSTVVRKQKILDLFKGFNYNRGEIIRGFNVSVGEQFIKLMARNIPPPEIKYKNGSITPQRGSWRPDRLTYLESAAIKKWAILVTANRINDMAVGKFAKMIQQEATKHNMGFEDYVKVNESNIRNLARVFEQFKKEGRSIVFVIISGFADSYSKVKQIAEINYGLLTQCVKSDTVERRMDLSTIGNIFLKVNSKLNGINHRLEPSRNLPMFSNQNEAVMFLGADVTHPSPDQSFIPSVVGVAGSYDPFAFQYKFSWRLQGPREEMISDMENIMIDQLRNFDQKRGRLPTHIIYYRDGVSNGQFKELERVELNAMNRACAKFPKYKPNITCLVVQKRHHTRFFPASPNIVHRNDRNQNVLPGTVVDTTITHPGEKQFFLVSHESIQGTAKPTKYCIIRDDANFSADDLEAMTYSLCHLFTRCNRAVSYPTPAYYAHHVAARGRVYIEGARINFQNLTREYESRNVDAIIRSNPLFFV